MADKTSHRAKPGRPRKGVRRSVVQIEREPLSKQIARALQSPALGYGVLYTAVFTTLCVLIAAWTAEQPMLAVGRVMTEDRTVRAAVETDDAAATDEQRELARQQTPRVYIADNAALAELSASIRNLPQAVASAESVEELPEAITSEFTITPEALALLRSIAEDQDDWTARVERFDAALRRRPLLDGETYLLARTVQGQSPKFRLYPDPESAADETNDVLVDPEDLVNLEDDRAAEALFGLSQQASIPLVLRPVVASRVINGGRATFRYDPAATAADQAEAADAVEPVVTRFPRGAVIFYRGDQLSRPQHELYVDEIAAWNGTAENWELWLNRLSVIGGVVAVAVGVFGYVAAYAPRICRNPARMAGLGGLMTISLALSCGLSVADPSLLPVMVSLPVVFAGSILVVAYDQRLALAIGTLLALLTCFSLGQGVETFAVTQAGLAAAAWRLNDIRDRRRLLEMSFWTGLALALTTLGTAAAVRPPTTAALIEAMRDAALIGGGGLAVGAVLLFLLPVIERAFDITTGMTLIELRDPKQPLLRELQQRAPGTYNHSLNVASIAETAADAIGADPLLTYVGALYHDIGKMNKPSYFVENQSGGPNKHDKLDPSMSLLVIVGHVKDGMEMARDAGLPRSLLHFIEGHHGTTLVEYFYQRARQRAAEDSEHDGGESEFTPADFPSEVEYRYPGPRPRTKECAILMLTDAVESATRSLPEPTPARIEQLVRRIADKRLADGQFDDCDLTLKDLNRICESIGASVASLYHGRVAYPSDPKAEPKPSGRTEDQRGDQKDDHGDNKRDEKRA